MSQVVETEDHGAVRLIRMNRPEVLNALNVELVSSLTEELSDAGADPEVKVAVLAGAGRAFCAGADRRATADLEERPGARSLWLAALQRLSAVVWEAPKPVIAAVNGHAVGGGFELALACDLIVASEDATFSLPEVSLGVAITGGGTFTLPAQIGLAQSKWLLYTGERLNAQRATEMGIVAQMVTGRAEGSALELAARLADHDAGALVAAKQGLHFGAQAGMAAALEREHALACARPAPPRMNRERGEGR